MVVIKTSNWKHFCKNRLNEACERLVEICIIFLVDAYVPSYNLEFLWVEHLLTPKGLKPVPRTPAITVSLGGTDICRLSTEGRDTAWRHRTFQGHGMRYRLEFCRASKSEGPQIQEAAVHWMGAICFVVDWRRWGFLFGMLYKSVTRHWPTLFWPDSKVWYVSWFLDWLPFFPLRKQNLVQHLVSILVHRLEFWS